MYMVNGNVYVLYFCDVNESDIKKSKLSSTFPLWSSNLIDN